MRVTGVIRKIDELGRIVIPKEIRKGLKLQEGSEMEILIQNNQIVLSKYSPLFEYSGLTNDCLDIIVDKYNLPCFVCDKDKIIAVKMLKKELIDININDQISMALKKPYPSFVQNTTSSITNHLYFYVLPIANQGYIYGGLVVLTNEQKDFSDLIMLTQFVGKQL